MKEENKALEFFAPFLKTTSPPSIMSLTELAGKVEEVLKITSSCGFTNPDTKKQLKYCADIFFEASERFAKIAEMIDRETGEF
jgi:hypothetical protein